MNPPSGPFSSQGLFGCLRIKEIGEADLKNDHDLFHISLTFKLIGMGFN